MSGGGDYTLILPGFVFEVSAMTSDLGTVLYLSNRSLIFKQIQLSKAKTLLFN